MAGKQSLVSLPEIVCTGRCRRPGSRAELFRVGVWFLTKHVFWKTDVFETNGRLVE